MHKSSDFAEPLKESTTDVHVVDGTGIGLSFLGFEMDDAFPSWFSVVMGQCHFSGESF